MGVLSKGRVDMRCNVRKNGEEASEGLRENPIGSSTILRFNSERRSGRHGREPRGEGSTKFPDVPLLENVTITISVIEGRSKGLTYRLKKLCITVGRIGGGGEF